MQSTRVTQQAILFYAIDCQGRFVAAKKVVVSKP